MSRLLEVDLGEWGGELRFKTLEQVLRWIEEERTRWLWLTRGPDVSVTNHVNARLSHLRDQLGAAVSQGESFEHLGYLFNEVYVVNRNQRILHSEGAYGRRVLEINEAEGVEAGSAAYAIAIGRANLGQMKDLKEVTGALLLAAPSLVDSDALARQLAQERRNLRDRAERLTQKLENESVQRWDQHQEDRLRGRKIARRWVKRRFGQWRSTIDKLVQESAEAHAGFVETQQATEAEFASLRAAFLEAMRLQAPAQYWHEKAGKHQIAEDAARNRLYVFFPCLAIGLTLIFVAVAVLLIRFPPSASATPIYFIVSAGLGSLAGVSFWVGRLLTKLYLSEHHLRIDAEEREIMTTTYLALTKEQAADEKDRQIILAALFRSTPDGIVKDDGMADGTLAALLARVVGPGKP